jgi:hypothetical protein
MSPAWRVDEAPGDPVVSAYRSTVARQAREGDSAVSARARRFVDGLEPAQPFADPARTVEITTPWVVYPELVEAECVSDGDCTYLSLVAMGNIEDLVAAQAEAYASTG